MKKILLHVCCAPDATHSINVLRELGFNVITFFYNPNVHPQKEYLKRLEAMEILSNIMKVDNIKNVPYEEDIKEWFRLTSNFKKEPEGGKRCLICFKMRLEKTAQKAKESNINIFTTTMTISPHKPVDIINKTGKEIADKYNLEYFESNFRKKDGFKKSVELSKKFGLYRQNYCGCIYSLYERKLFLKNKSKDNQ